MNPQEKKNLIVFMSDFGGDSVYPGIVKGVIGGINPDAVVVDLTHSVPPFDILLGALYLSLALKWFPAGTLFLSVVDPGVGGVRRPIIIVTKSYVFIGPDNGLMYDAASKDGIVSTYEIERGEHTFQTRCETFHGRDLFAPVAARILLGFPPERFGKEGGQIVPLVLPGEKILKAGIEGTVLFVDPFGNIVTSIVSSSFETFAGASRNMMVNGVEGQVASTFGEIPRGLLGIVPGSFDRVEICLYRENAASFLGVARGDLVRIEKRGKWKNSS